MCEVSPPAVLVRRQPFIGPVGQGCRMGCQLHVNFERSQEQAPGKMSGHTQVLLTRSRRDRALLYVGRRVGAREALEAAPG